MSDALLNKSIVNFCSSPLFWLLISTVVFVSGTFRLVASLFFNPTIWLTTMSEYELAAKGALKLKGDAGVKKKKKHKKNKEEKEKIEEYLKETKKPELQPTKAELAFQKMQEKVEMERIMKKASMTHKQRVEEFNKHLDNLTEHFDIPKVSWTK